MMMMMMMMTITVRILYSQKTTAVLSFSSCRTEKRAYTQPSDAASKHTLLRP
jgi:hypothetical protein